ncbi:hypothetical protein MTP99_009020 [Tenebrio molitor]|jgi:hypothetical protein|nr:hypothetical protein MTP99_009020 [Tenebrio molitor]
MLENRFVFGKMIFLVSYFGQDGGLHTHSAKCETTVVDLLRSLTLCGTASTWRCPPNVKIRKTGALAHNSSESPVIFDSLRRSASTLFSPPVHNSRRESPIKIHNLQVFVLVVYFRRERAHNERLYLITTCAVAALSRYEGNEATFRSLNIKIQEKYTAEIVSGEISKTDGIPPMQKAVWL